MPIIGETKPAKELGYKGHGRTMIWAACAFCSQERWVQLNNGEPQWARCLKCRDIKKPKKPRIITDEQRNPKTKRCNKCGVIYPATDKYFNKDKHCYSGLTSPCKKCLNKTTRERLLKQGKIKYHRFLSTKTARQKRVAQTMSIGIRRAIISGKQGRHWESLIGYTLKDLMKHIEMQFTDGMSWGNYGTATLNNNPPHWHIDHIIPKSAFNLDSPDNPDVKRCWALSNLQPLWGSDNSKKGSKILKPFQPSLKIK